MDHFAGLDVSVKETSVCIVDDTGGIVREVKVASEPEALLKVLGNPAYRFDAVSGSWPTVGDDVADLDLSVRCTGIIFLLRESGRGGGND